ncbi:DUF3131 domain-containing protein [bacterium]|nr:DUF3131 domain-containing protein [bacterium]
MTVVRPFGVAPRYRFGLVFWTVEGSMVGPLWLVQQFAKRNRELLQDLYQRLTARKDPAAYRTPAQEWFLDNFYLIIEQVRGILQDLSPKFYAELPVYASGPAAGELRVYELSLQLVAHTDSEIDSTILKEFIQALQKVSVLTTGELWAFAIFLRIVLIENITRLMVRAEKDSQDADQADLFLDGLPTDGSAEPEFRIKGFSDVYIVRLLLRLREKETKLFSRLHDQMIEQGKNLEDLIWLNNQDLVNSRLSISNAIVSLRALASIDWPDFIDSVSEVDRILRLDPAGFYEKCDFSTRDRYRHVVEQIAKHSQVSETEVAQLTLDFSEKASEERKKHVGFYLLDEGRTDLEKATQFRLERVLRIKRLVLRHPMLFYQGFFLLVTLLLTGALARYAISASQSQIWGVFVFLLALIPASSITLTITNWLVTLFFRPEYMPRLQFKKGIPQELKTIVALPSMLTSSEEIQELVSRIELHYLANHEDQLDFALLTDFIDADAPTTPNDDHLLQEAKEKIALLNRKYPRSTGARFLLFHRIRKWNPGEGKWMGWERKRGKLEEFNRLLLGKDHTSFEAADVPRNIQYVITLDSDTILPRGAARKLIGILSHPLNRPLIDRDARKVVKGYGILQPRVSHTLRSANTSLFARAFSGPAGIDPYTRAVSDVYQDLFGEGSFIGKGIYDLRAFHDTLDERFPENTLLSHDLVEGAFARTGLVSDIELFDDHPSDYTSYSLRHHRWVRGDWQAAFWLYDSFFSKERNSISGLNAWKLIDNLRRSLVSPAVLVLFLLGWTLLPGSSLFWTFFSAVVLAAPILVPLTGLFMGSFKGVPFIDHLRNVRASLSIAFTHVLLAITFLANDALLHLDAIVRTVFRIVQRKKLLEWTTAAQAERSRSKGLAGYHRRMWGSLALTAVTSLLILEARSDVWNVSAPVLVFWMFTPTIAWLTGLTVHVRVREIPQNTRYVLRSYARECWRYFETFVNEQNQWLPSDNFQQDPAELIAHRTSPTNVGFALLANISAFDFGYIGVTDFVQRTELTLATLTRLSTFNGHLFNWYDTITLKPLEPRYVSTVDSGNLASALLTLRQFVLKDQELFSPPRKRLEGIADDLTGFLNWARARKPSVTATTISEVQTIRREVRRFLKNPFSEISEEDLLIWLQKVLSQLTQVGLMDSECEYWLDSAKKTVASHLADFERPQDLRQRLRSIAREAETLVQEMDFRFLYDEDRGLFSIGFNVTNGRLDPSYYDLFASESRLTSFVAIAKGDVPQSHWFRMSRTMTARGPHRLMASWSGSMFEYLMPLLFIRNESATLWDYTYEKAVKAHKTYGHLKGVPWGVSESAYNRRDASMNYQYGPFGVPWLGLKRELEADLVVAPYATFLAAMVTPMAAHRNLEHLEKMGAHGRFGFFESIDFTPERVPEGSRSAIVRTFMAHHLGMSFVALNNVLHDRIMQERFHLDPSIQAIDLLVQERMPATAGLGQTKTVDERPQLFGIQEPAVAREFHTPYLSPPRTQILSNGRYSIMMSTSGSGYSEWNGIRVNHWREDPTCDATGTYFYLKDRTAGTIWSAGFQPVRKLPAGYNVSFSEDRIEFRRRDGAIETHYDIVVSPDENAEVRRLTIVNTSSTPHEIEITSYNEIILTLAANDLAHRTFSNLFVQTEFVPELGALIARRATDSRNKTELWAGHLVTLEKENGRSDLQFETDRSRFLGRNNSVENPQALRREEPLSGTTGAVLDPIFSLRRVLKIAPYSREMLAYITMVGNNREEVISLIHRYREFRSVSRVFELASAHAQVMLHQLSLNREDADLYQRLAGRIVFSTPSLRPRPSVLERNKKTQSALWQFGISGDLPVCLVRVEEQNDLPIVRQVLQAHEYWRMKGLVVDLVILNEFPTSYFQDLQDELHMLIRSSSARELLNVSGGVFVLRLDLLNEEDRVLLRTVARAEIHAQRGSLARQMLRSDEKEALPGPHVVRSMFPMEDPPYNIPESELILANDFGGFTPDQKEYKIRLKPNQSTPAPWINVISNPEFGCQISEKGAGMTWSVNSRENRLTPFSNDPVSDPVDSTIYIRDEETGRFWSVTPEPLPGNGKYEIAHGAGYTTFETGSYGLEHKFIVSVPVEDPVKILRLTIRNQTRRTRELSATFYAEMVLGTYKERTAHYVNSSVDSKTGALLFRNPYNNEFAERIAFASVNDEGRTITADRNEFLGPCGSVKDPAALRRENLSGRTGPGLDPCAAIQSRISLRPFSEHTFLFLLGEGTDLNQVRTLVKRYSNAADVENALVEVRNFWDETLAAIQVETPDPSLNVLMNRWLLYQALSCRFWSRSALYQSSGAYGFRDQLQDALALAYARPDLLETHLLRAAAHQFEEGDVQHWWHPPTGKGVRTRISDDLLWLPYCTAFYCSLTGNLNVLDERIPYLKGKILEPLESEEYFEPQTSEEEGSLFEHCLRAIDRSLRFGRHELPLIGSGDWNDGFSRVGIQERGESVWLGWFLIKILNDFGFLCEKRGEIQKAQAYKEQAQKLRATIHYAAWDGQWFLRSFHDDGTVMGSADSVESRIDSIAQSWSILSGAGDPEKSQQAMQSVERLLFLKDQQLALLFTPPFGSTAFDPGYIRDYPPGIRENGGQYNHAVTWLIAAYCQIGFPDKAYELFQTVNPIKRTDNFDKAWQYRLEPYAVAADIYSHPNHIGRGGWSWYTGSAAWLYRACLEYILGFRLQGESFSVQPALPSDWPGYRMRFRNGDRVYEIAVERKGTKLSVKIDGEESSTQTLRAGQKHPHPVTS